VPRLLPFAIGMTHKNSWLQKRKQDVLALWEERFHAEDEMSRLHRFLHFWVLVVKSFNRNRCPIRASALSFTTLLALIPMLAVVISVTSALLKKQGEEQIYQFVDKMVSNMVPSEPHTNTTRAIINLLTNRPPADFETNSSTASLTEGTNAPMVAVSSNGPAAGSETNHEAAIAAAVSEHEAQTAPDSDVRTTKQKEAAKWIHEFIHNTRSGTLGATGAILLVLVGIRMLGSIESTFNDIWGVTRGRNWLSRIQIYCTGIVFGPLLLVGAGALAGGSHLQATQKLIMKMPIVGPMIFPTLTLIVLWLTFTLFYQFIPNTKVRFRAALVGGIVSGTVWHVNNLFGFLYVSRVVSNSRIYGSLGLVPVFMAGVYFSWYILLFGAQIAYAFQNRALYLQERIAENVNQRGREFVALRLMTCIGQRFQRGMPPPSGQEMSDELCIPSRLVQQVLQTLIAAHLVIEVSGVEPGYTPGRPLEQINAHHLLQAMRARGQELLTRDEPVREEVYGEFARIQEAEKQISSTITMLALVTRAEACRELVPLPANEKESGALKTLVPTAKTDVEPVMPSEPPVESLETTEPAKPERAVAAETPPTAHPPPENIYPIKPITEPLGDEERDFPL
jgi:membrane protein